MLYTNNYQQYQELFGMNLGSYIGNALGEELRPVDVKWKWKPIDAFADMKKAWMDVSQDTYAAAGSSPGKQSLDNHVQAHNVTHAKAFDYGDWYKDTLVYAKAASNFNKSEAGSGFINPANDYAGYLNMLAEQPGNGLGPMYHEYAEVSPTSQQPQAVGNNPGGMLGRGATDLYQRNKWMYESNPAELGIPQGVANFVSGIMSGISSLGHMAADLWHPTPSSMSDFGVRGGILVNGIRSLAGRIDDMFNLSAQYQAQMQLGDDLWSGVPSDYARDSALSAGLGAQAGSNVSHAWSMFRSQPGVKQWSQGTEAVLNAGIVAIAPEASEWGIFAEAEVAGRGVGLTSRLSRAQIREYLANAHEMPRQQLVNDIESLGLKLKGQGKGGKFMEFEDKLGRVRIKVHPPDSKTSYDHIHIYDLKMRPLGKDLNAVSRRSPDAHIEVQPLDGQSNQKGFGW